MRRQVSLLIAGIPLVFLSIVVSGNAGEVPTYAYHGYEKYKTEAHFRAFASTSPYKKYGVAMYYYRSSTVEEAIDGAINECRAIVLGGDYAATASDCKVHSIGNIFVYGMNDEEFEKAKKLYKSKRNATNADLVGFVPGESSIEIATPGEETVESGGKVVALGLTLPELITKATSSTAAQYALGEAYEIGRAVPNTLIIAQRWYMRAAKAGHKLAQYKIGWMYEGGLGRLPTDKVSALEWYMRAVPIGAAVNALARLDASNRGSDDETPEATTDDESTGDEASPSLDVVQIEKKLQLISKWYEKGLITAEEAAAQRKVLLSTN